MNKPDRRANETTEQYAARIARMARFAESRSAGFPDVSQTESRRIIANDDTRLARAYR